MYIDGHERVDVVNYRDKFVERWMGATGYEKRMHQWDNDGNELRPTGFPVKGGHFRIIPVTHDESTFYQNDEHKITWAQQSERPLPKPKGEGQSIMVSDFLTAEWGRLRDGDECVIFSSHFFSCSVPWAGKPVSSLRLGRTVMGTSLLRTSLHRWTRQLTSLKARQMAILSASSSSIMHPAIRSRLPMPYLHIEL